MKEGEQNKLLCKEESSKFLDNEYEQYRNKNNKMNNDIYILTMSYFNYLGSNVNLYKGSNDYDYNRRISEMKQKGKHDRIVNSEKYLARRQQEKQEKMEYEKLIIDNKTNSQKNYRNYLDIQM